MDIKYLLWAEGQPDPEAQLRWGPELSLICSWAGWSTAEPGCGTLCGANLSTFLKLSNFPPDWCPEDTILGSFYMPKLVNRGLNDCPCSQTLPIAAGGGVLAHGSTSSSCVGVPARHPDLPWPRLGHDHCPRPFPQLARDAKIHPKKQ